MKSLFVPLKTKHYEAFEDGSKEHEFRLYGSRWNEKTCRIGRKVTISKGYGKKNRLYGEVICFVKADSKNLAVIYQNAIREIYGDGNKEIAIITIKIYREQHETTSNTSLSAVAYD